MKTITHKVYQDLRQLPENWDEKGNDVFLSSAYLKAQKEAHPSNMQYFYIALFSQDKLIAKACVQRLHLLGKDSFHSKTSWWKQILRNQLKINLLSFGNMKMSGQHAFEILENISPEKLIPYWEKALKEIKTISKKENKKIHLTLYKDFNTQLKDKISPQMNKYATISVQPNMMMELNRGWQNFDDYLAAMKTKYRTRAKRAFKKFDGVEVVEAELEQIAQHNETIYAQYRGIAARVGFNTYILPKNYFYEMKKNLPNQFKLFLLFHQSVLIGFYTIFENKGYIETGFLGYDEKSQKEKQTYINMLYLMIRYAIENQYQRIDFSRTALEIKSSVGARPEEIYGFLKHRSPVLNFVLEHIFKSLKPKNEWQQRQPFKEIPKP